MTVINRKKVANVFLFLGTFFNPLGYDILLDQVIQWTKSFVISILIFYLLSLLSFILYYVFSKKRFFLFLGAFFLPFGYDFILYGLMKYVGGYWNAIIVFYVISALFFTLYFITKEKNIKKIK